MANARPTSPLPDGLDLDAFARAGGVVHVGLDTPAAPEPNHLQEARLVHDARAVDVEIASAAVYQAVPGFGLTDQQAPSLRQIDLSLRGLFAELLRIRANAIASAIVGGRGHDRFEVQRMVQQGEFEPVEVEHPWVQLLMEPNANRSAREVWFWASMTRDLRGSADFIIEDGPRGVPVAMYEIYPEFGELQPVPDATGGVAGYVFWRSDGRTIELEPRDVIRFRHPHPSSPYRSMSLLERAAFYLDKALYADVYERDMLKDGRFPPGYLKTDQDIAEHQAKRYGREFRERYVGAATSGGMVKGVPVLGKGLEIKATPWRAEDLALIDSGKLNDNRLFWVSGVPQGLLSDQANRANADAAQYTFAYYTVQPEVELLADQITFGFRRSFGATGALGRRLRVAAPDVVPVDPRVQVEIDERELRIGAATPNELRRRRGRDEVEGGDVPLIQVGLQTLDRTVNPPTFTGFGGSASSSSSSSTDSADDEEPEPAEPEADDSRAAGRAIAAAEVLRMIGRSRQRGHALDEDTLGVEWRAVDAVRREAETPILGEALTLFNEQRDAVLAALDTVRGQQGREARMESVLTAEALFDLPRWIEETLRRFAPHIDAAIFQGWTVGMDRVGVSGIDWTSDSLAARSAAEAITAKTRSVAETTHARLAEEVQAGLTAGETIDQIAGRVRNLFDGMAPYRAQTIAQTAGIGSFEAGQLQAFSDAGITERVWLTQRDGAVREAHMMADGQQVPTADAFQVGDELLLYPGDPAGTADNVINCRCTVLPVTSRPTEEAGRVINTSGMTERELARVQQSIRDRGIRQAHAAGETNLNALAERFSTSRSTVERALGWK